MPVCELFLTCNKGICKRNTEYKINHCCIGLKLDIHYSLIVPYGHGIHRRA